MLSHQTTGPGEVMEMITFSSADALSSDNGPGEVMEMITFSTSDALSSDNGARGSEGNDNVLVFGCSLIRQRGQGK